MIQVQNLVFIGFREVHDKFGMGDHKTKPYRTSPTPNNGNSDDEDVWW